MEILKIFFSKIIKIIEMMRWKNTSQIILSKSGKLIKKNKKYFLILNDGNIINLDSKKTNIIQFNKIRI